MSGMILTFPILAGKVEAWRRFCQEISGARLQMYLASRRRFGITGERMALMETPYGATAVTTLEAPNVDRALGQVIASDHSFDVWYRERLQELHGITLTGYEQFSQPMLNPDNQELLFEWTIDSSNPKIS